MFSKDINIDSKILQKNRIQLLIEDEVWIKLFGNVEEKSIVNCKKELKQLSEKQKEIDRELNSKKLEKKKIMAKILELSDLINNDNGAKISQDSVQLLDKFQDEIHSINGEIDSLMFESEVIPNEIRKANYELLKVTVKYAYKELIDAQSTLDSLNEDIEVYKSKLKSSIEKKGDYEERINSTYSFLHKVLGREEIEKLDRNMLD